MGVGSARASRLTKVGLRRASMEGQCAMTHANYLNQSGFAYCPWCGILLEVHIECATCGRKFVSEKAYTVHLDREMCNLLKANPCPNETREAHHPIRWQKNRRMFYCPTCQIEYPLKEDANP